VEDDDLDGWMTESSEAGKVDVVDSDGDEIGAEGDEGKDVVEVFVEMVSNQRVVPFGGLFFPVLLDGHHEIFSEEDERGEERALSFEERSERRDLHPSLLDLDGVEVWDCVV